MPSAKQIAARKAFVKKYAKKGKRKSSSAKKQSRESLPPTRFSKDPTQQKYIIIRFYRDQSKRSKIIKRNLTLAQAKKHTNDPKTRKAGVWFDGFDKQTDSTRSGY